MSPVNELLVIFQVTKNEVFLVFLFKCNLEYLENSRWWTRKSGELNTKSKTRRYIVKEANILHINFPTHIW